MAKKVRYQRVLSLSILRHVVRRQFMLRQMANAVNDHLVATDLEDRSMRRIVSKPVVKFSDHNVESITLSGDTAPLRMV